MKSYVEEHMRKSLQGHVLEIHAEHEKVKAFYLKRPERTRMMSCLILFTVEGIVITGDLTPCRNGVISCYGYGLGWFAGHKSEDYLCEKFLQKEFVPELALSSFRANVLQSRRDGSISRERAREAFDWIVDGQYEEPLTSRDFYDAYYACFQDTPGCGYGYNPRDAGWLCAIQQKFAELYAKQREVAA